jgi:ATP-dependent phosphoenolpyruvate carboxykinase
MNSEIYNINIYNIGKKIPPNYNKLVIPKIEKIINHNSLLKNSIYNALISLYNNGINSGIIEHINIYTTNGNYKVQYEILTNKINLNLTTPGGIKK